MTAARDVTGLALQLHCGGLFIGRGVRRVNDEMRDLILTQDARITAMTGQWFGPGYRGNLLNGIEVLLDSAPPSRAVLAAERIMVGRGADMLHAIHQAHYIDGRSIVEEATLLTIAEDLGLPRTVFAEIWHAIGDPELARDITHSRSLMGKYGVSGLPTFLLERDEVWTLIDHQRYYGRPQAWRAMLQESLQRVLH